MLPSVQVKAPPGVGDGEVPLPAIPTGGLLVAAWHVLTTHTSYHDLDGDYFVARRQPPAPSPRTAPARTPRLPRHPRTGGQLTGSRPVIFGQLGTTSGKRIWWSLSGQSDIDPIPKVIHRKRYLRCADIDRKIALALLRHGRGKRV